MYMSDMTHKLIELNISQINKLKSKMEVLLQDHQLRMVETDTRRKQFQIVEDECEIVLQNFKRNKKN